MFRSLRNQERAELSVYNVPIAKFLRQGMKFTAEVVYVRKDGHVIKSEICPFTFEP